MVIYAGSHREDAYGLIRKYIDLRGWEPHVFSEEEASSRNPTIERMTQEGIFIFPV